MFIIVCHILFRETGNRNAIGYSFRVDVTELVMYMAVEIAGEKESSGVKCRPCSCRSVCCTDECGHVLHCFINDFTFTG